MNDEINMIPMTWYYFNQTEVSVFDRIKSVPQNYKYRELGDGRYKVKVINEGIIMYFPHFLDIKDGSNRTNPYGLDSDYISYAVTKGGYELEIERSLECSSVFLNNTESKDGYTKLNKLQEVELLEEHIKMLNSDNKNFMLSLNLIKSHNYINL